MRRVLTTVTLALAAVVSTALLSSTPANAGGPTSVVITEPSAARATAVYYTSSTYEELVGLLADGRTLDQEPPSLGGRSVNLTWLIHDVTPWQTQQLFTDAEGGPVVVTNGSDVLGNAGRTTWSRPADGKALLRLVDQVFEGGAQPRAADTSEPAAAPAAAPEAAPAEPGVTERVVVETDWFSLSGWRWLVPGVLLGAGIALLATRTRSRDQDPRQELVDIAP